MDNCFNIVGMMYHEYNSNCRASKRSDTLNDEEWLWKEDFFMSTGVEVIRIILGLRAIGVDEKDINDFILYVETGNEKYKPCKEKIVEWYLESMTVANGYLFFHSWNRM